jgi:hypothetical protein
MSPHLSNLQLFFSLSALVLIACLTLAAIADIRRRRKTPPFLNYFYSDFDPDQYDRDSSRQTSFSGLDEWRTYNRAQAQAFKGRNTTAHHSYWE